jgi:hypothetical protein
MGKIRDFLMQDAGTAVDRMNEPWIDPFKVCGL